jgi:hypothetical protein
MTHELPQSAADHPDENVRYRYFHRTYTSPLKPTWLDDDKSVVRLIEYLRDPAEKVRQVAYAVLVNALVMQDKYPFRHQAQARSEALAIANDDTLPLAIRLPSVCLLAHFDGNAAAPLIASALTDVDHLNEEHNDFVSNIGWIYDAAWHMPHKSYVPHLKRFLKAGSLDTVEIRKLIWRCNRAKNP